MLVDEYQQNNGTGYYFHRPPFTGGHVPSREMARPTTSAAYNLDSPWWWQSSGVERSEDGATPRSVAVTWTRDRALQSHMSRIKKPKTWDVLPVKYRSVGGSRTWSLPMADDPHAPVDPDWAPPAKLQNQWPPPESWPPPRAWQPLTRENAYSRKSLAMGHHASEGFNRRVTSAGAGYLSAPQLGALARGVSPRPGTGRLVPGRAGGRPTLCPY